LNHFGLPVQVDPFVASFTGGAVGVISSLMLVEVNNVKNQAKSRCQYCKVRLALCALYAKNQAKSRCHYCKVRLA
jgi:hypothetical protein